MRQYCRYCSFCIDGNGLYCTSHEKSLTEKQFRRENHCPEFILSELGDVRTGNQYRPKKPKPLKVEPERKCYQMSFIVDGKMTPLSELR